MRESTPLPVIANVTRVVTKVIDRLTGDRGDYPLLVAAVTVEALKSHGFNSRIMYGEAAWIEVLEGHAIQWAGCWSGNIYFWVQTEFSETVDLNASVNYKKHAHGAGEKKAIYSPPILWSREIPGFYRYAPEGIAELELFEEKDQRRFETACLEVREKCRRELLEEDEDFPNEAILCPDRKLLDDSKGSFKFFDRTLAVTGMIEAPI